MGIRGYLLILVSIILGVVWLMHHSLKSSLTHSMNDVKVYVSQIPYLRTSALSHVVRPVLLKKSQVLAYYEEERHDPSQAVVDRVIVLPSIRTV